MSGSPSSSESDFEHDEDSEDNFKVSEPEIEDMAPCVDSTRDIRTIGPGHLVT